jgi:predicted TIM-barrel fold metal-dependent hydrolase
MDIVDAQIHLFLNMDIDACLAAMNSMGIQAALIDEFWGYEGDHPLPGHLTSHGVFRPTAPGAMMASMKYPDRFSWLLRIDPRDSDFNNIVSSVRSSPHGRALRLEARSTSEVENLAGRGCIDFFRAAVRHSLPVFILSPGNSKLLVPYLKALPDLRIVIDHCGLPHKVEEYEDVLALAKFPNAFLKWCHAPRVFGSANYPFPELSPYLARTLDAFGPERVMWASDFTAIRVNCTWAESLFYMRDHMGLSAGDKEWLLGKTARALLEWPAPEAPFKPVRHKH